MKRFWLALLLSFLCLPAFAQTPVQVFTAGSPIAATNPLSTTAGGVAAANSTSVTGNVAATQTQITFTAASTHFTISIGGTSPAITYLSLNTGVTTANFAINPTTATAGSFTYNGPAVTSIFIIGASAAGTYSVFAY